MPDVNEFLNIMWWNINGKVHYCLKNAPFTNNFNIIFLEETCLPYDNLPVIDNFTLISNPENKHRKHGGISVYIQDKFADEIFEIENGLIQAFFYLKSVLKFEKEYSY